MSQDPPTVAIAAAALWRARIVAAAAKAGVPLTDPAPGVPGIRSLCCDLGDLARLVPRLTGDRPSARPAIGAHSDSIGDRALRDAVADVAALLSLHGNVVVDLDAGRAAAARPDVVVSAAVEGPKWTDTAVTLPVGADASGRPLAVRLTAGPGYEHAVLELARLVEADVA